MEIPILWWLCVSLDHSIFQDQPNCTKEPNQAQCLKDMADWAVQARAWRVRSGLLPATYLAACIPQE